MDLDLDLHSAGSLEKNAVFRFYRLRFHFRSSERVRLPAGKAGNVIRGALGTILRRIACAAECPGARSCESRANCAYARIFEPVESGGPSGLQDPPRPFVVRARHLDGVTVVPGGMFSFDVHLFLVHDPPLPHFILAFSQLAEAGLGPSRGRVRLEGVDLIGLDESAPTHRIFEGGRFAAAELPAPLALPLLGGRGETDGEMRIRFCTPLELKQDGRIAGRPEFGFLLARVAERLSNLSSMYGEKLEWDWRGVVERARAVRLVEMSISAEASVRFSTKTRQRHGVGGIIGEARYAGRVEEFLPMLLAAKYCGVGRHTVWGNGVLEVELWRRGPIC